MAPETAQTTKISLLAWSELLIPGCSDGEAGCLRASLFSALQDGFRIVSESAASL